MFLLAYQSIGVIYGDIGTSPLYVFSSTFTEAPNHTDLLGALSLILWSVTLMVTVKYILIILHADNDGEGGTFSTYSLLSKYVRYRPNILNKMLTAPRPIYRIEILARLRSYVCCFSMRALVLVLTITQAWKDTLPMIWADPLETYDPP